MTFPKFTVGVGYFTNIVEQFICINLKKKGKSDCSKYQPFLSPEK